MVKECLNCGKEVPAEKRGDSKFCSTSCKNSFNYRKKEERFKGLPDIKPVEKETDELSKSLRGVIENRPFKESDTGLGNDLIVDPGNPALPPEFIIKEAQVESFLYRFLKDSITRNEQKKKELETEFKKLETHLKQQAKRDGSEWIWAGAASGGLIGLNKGGSILKGLLYGLAGTLAGRAMKSITNDGREKDKKKQTEIIKNRMLAIQGEYKELLDQIENDTGLLKRTPQFDIQQEKVLNPAYQKALDSSKQKRTLEGAENKIPEEDFKFKSEKVVSARDLDEVYYPTLGFEGIWKKFFGLPSTNFRCLIHGNPGEGKSTFGMWLGRYLAQNFGRVLYVSGEEGLNKTFKDKLDFCKADVKNFFVADFRTGEEFMKEVLPNEPHFIILDSLHDMGIDAKMMKTIKDRYHNTAIIAIDQNNKKGELFGTNEMKHLNDIVVNIRDYTAETTKNRFKTKGMAFKTEDFMGSQEPGANQLRVISLKKENNGQNQDEQNIH